MTVARTGFTFGEKAFVEIVRTNRTGEPHQIREGATVNFFTRTPGVDRPEKQGVVNYATRERMKIILNGKDVPDWLDAGSLGVELLFDDRSYHEMEKALAAVAAAEKGRTAELRMIFEGRKPSFEDEISSFIDIHGLNPSQNEAVNHVLASRDVAVIHGPPGTGKTTTLVQAIRQLSKREPSILVTAPSNAAVDLLTEKLAAEGLSVVRVGNVSRVDESILSHTLEALLAAHPEARHIKKVKIEAANLRKEARKFKRQFNFEQRSERDRVKKMAAELENWAKTLEDRLLEETLDAAQCVCCTLVGAAHPVLAKRHFKTAIIDEASQALEPATWIPILKASKVVLAGDPFQLPPTVKSLEAQKGGLSKTLMDKMLERQDGHSLLTVQYRMHRAIMGFSNAYFYENRLEAAPLVAERTLGGWPALTFIDTAGCSFEEKSGPTKGGRAGSKFNPDEFLILREHFLKLKTSLEKEAEPTEFEAVGPNFELQNSEPKMPSVAWISPYKEQVVWMETQAKSDPTLAYPALSVATIDGFQGQERDVVYLSLVRSNAKNEIGFLSDFRRMNVALTRARKMLVVIGDSATVGSNRFYASFLDFVEKNGVYETAWAHMGG